MTTYNGWRNYQTWNVALWFGNDEGLYRSVTGAPIPFNRDRAEMHVRELLPDGTPDLKERANPYRGVDWSAISRAFNEMRG
jgi:hypothetical protein